MCLQGFLNQLTVRLEVTPPRLASGEDCNIRVECSKACVSCSNLSCPGDSSEDSISKMFVLGSYVMTRRYSKDIIDCSEFMVIEESGKVFEFSCSKPVNHVGVCPSIPDSEHYGDVRSNSEIKSRFIFLDLLIKFIIFLDLLSDFKGLLVVSSKIEVELHGVKFCSSFGPHHSIEL